MTKMISSNPTTKLFVLGFLSICWGRGDTEMAIKLNHLNTSDFFFVVVIFETGSHLSQA